MSSVACRVASVSRLRPWPDERHVGPGDQLAARDPQQLAAAYGPHRDDRRLRRLGPLDQRLHLGERGLGAQRHQRLPQHLHALRLALEQVGGVARGAEDVGQPLGDLALVAQHREVPRRTSQALADPPEAEQPGVGVGRVGEPLQQHRQQGPLDVGGARDPAGQRLEVAQRGLGVGVPEGGEPRLGGLQRQPGLGAGQLGDGAEQGAVEQLLVQPAHLAAVVAPLLVELDGRLGEEPERAPEPAQRRLVLGQHVRAPELVAAGSGARGCAGRRRPRGASRRPRGRRSRPWSGWSSALRVAPSRRDGSARPWTSWSSWTANSTSRRPPEPSLSWRSASCAGMWSTTRRRIAWTSGTKPVALGGAPHHRLDHLEVGAAEREVAGHRAGLEQGLELPGLGPLLVVAAVAGQGADQRALAALGAQVGVDRPDRALAGVVGADPHQVRGELGRGAQRGPVVGGLPRLQHGGLVDEDHVDVGDVVELVAAALAHRDHRRAGPMPRSRPPGRGRRPAPPRASRPRGRRSPRRRRRARRGGPGRARRGAAGSGGTPPAARRRPPRRAVRRRAGRRAGRRRPRSASPRGRRTPPARVLPSVGSVSSRQWSGCRTRWWVSAALAPSTQHSRIAVPSSSATSASIAAPAPRRLLVERLDQPQQALQRGVGVGRSRRAWRSAAHRPRRAARCRVPRSRRRRSRGGRRSPTSSSALLPRQRGEARDQRPPVGDERGRRRPRSRRARRPGRGPARRGRRGRRRPSGVRRPRRPRGAPGSPTPAGRTGRPAPRRRGCAPARRRRRGARPRRRCSSGSRPRRRCARRPSRRPPRPRSSRPAAARRVWPRGLRSTAPPSATAITWWPRQMPSSGVPAVDRVADARLQRRQPRDGVVVVGTHVTAQHQHPVVRRQVGQRRRRRRGGTPRARSRPPRATRRRGAAGQDSWCSTTRMRARHLRGPGSIRSRS